MASERPSVEHNVRLLIQEGQDVLREYRLEQLQADLFKLALSKELGAPIATEDEIDDYQFESAINGAFHLECVVLELAHYLLQDRSLSGMVETHIVSFAHLAARTYEYLGSYCEQAKNLRITNLFMHAMFNYALSLHGANAKAQILRQKADQMFARQADYRYQVQDPLENFAYLR
ncbi:MAG: hypothetical protein HWN51_03115 [Desulfobacterales bacterium]|nr:hypothetical protein [Desulfobacterales bacterium]